MFDAQGRIMLYLNHRFDRLIECPRSFQTDECRACDQSEGQDHERWTEAWRLAMHQGKGEVTFFCSFLKGLMPYSMFLTCTRRHTGATQGEGC